MFWELGESSKQSNYQRLVVEEVTVCLLLVYWLEHDVLEMADLSAEEVFIVERTEQTAGKFLKLLLR